MAEIPLWISIVCFIAWTIGWAVLGMLAGTILSHRHCAKNCPWYYHKYTNPFYKMDDIDD